MNKSGINRVLYGVFFGHNATPDMGEIETWETHNEGRKGECAVLSLTFKDGRTAEVAELSPEVHGRVYTIQLAESHGETVMAVCRDHLELQRMLKRIMDIPSDAVALEKSSRAVALASTRKAAQSLAENAVA